MPVQHTHPSVVLAARLVLVCAIAGIGATGPTEQRDCRRTTLATMSEHLLLQRQLEHQGQNESSVSDIDQTVGLAWGTILNRRWEGSWPLLCGQRADYVRLWASSCGRDCQWLPERVAGNWHRLRVRHEASRGWKYLVAYRANHVRLWDRSAGRDGHWQLEHSPHRVGYYRIKVRHQASPGWRYLVGQSTSYVRMWVDGCGADCDWKVPKSWIRAMLPNYAPPTGQWRLIKSVLGGPIYEEIWRQVTSSSHATVTKSSQDEVAISVGAEAKFEAGGVSMTLSSSTRHTVERSITQGISTVEGRKSIYTCPEKEDLGRAHLWQWVVKDAATGTEWQTAYVLCTWSFETNHEPECPVTHCGRANPSCKASKCNPF